jgi:hypothetical protein
VAPGGLKTTHNKITIIDKDLNKTIWLKSKTEVTKIFALNN